MTRAPGSAARRRVRIEVTGTVQGVGYRPFVYRLAHELGVAGWVLNDDRGVVVEAEGEPAVLDALAERLSSEAPPLARVTSVTAEEVPVTNTAGFVIAASERTGAPSAPVTPDSAMCADCLAELSDPADRRHRYPFINCTNCGPRFTIVRGVPYDRPLTTMAGFEMCAACRAEYEDPLDRRFHAQPNACPVCGPRATLVGADGSPAGGDGDAVRAAATALIAGQVIAVKGLGGYHLACRADDEDAVAALRTRKHREHRPFALLVADVATTRELVWMSDAEETLLTSVQRPIVLMRRRADAPVAAAVAPDAPDLGLMTPYTPLHHLLATDAGVPLVLTSGNLSDEPIAFLDTDARERLATIADAFLVHDRPIETRTDDSVVRVDRERPLVLRRSRGYVPDALALPVELSRPVLACGAELKNAFCVGKGDRAWVSHHIGDLKNYETLRSFSEGVAHFERLFAVAPEVVAHDLHPDYLSTRYALEREGVELIGVQHHHAHLAATLAEHGETGPAVGAIYDGTGHGTDGVAWGGELLVGGLAGFDRAGHLRPARLAGGDRAVQEPWRMACAWLIDAAGEDAEPPPALTGVPMERWNAVAEMTRSGFSAPETTSMGRLFDAVAAMCGLWPEVTYEGQAAIALEACATAHADPNPVEPYPFDVTPQLVLDPRPTVLAVLADARAGVAAGTIAARFHVAVAGATARAVTALAGARGLDTVVLSGGVFQNRLLLALTSDAIGRSGLRVLVPERLPPNDGQIAYGQMAVAAALQK